MSIFFTSDLHLFHEKILDYRPFESLEQMHQTICQNWTKQIRYDDTVYVLGDLSVSSGRSQALNMLADLPGTKYLINGNHDRTSPAHNNHQLYHREYFTAFDAVMDCAKLKLPKITKSGAGLDVMLSHYPYDGEHRNPDSTELDDRYAELRLRDLSVPLIHGHVHDEWKLRYSKQNTPMINVGLERWNYTPVRAETLHAELRAMLKINER